MSDPLDTIRAAAARIRISDAVITEAFHDAIGFAVDDIQAPEIAVAFREDRCADFQISPHVIAQYAARLDREAALEEFNMFINSYIAAARDDFSSEVARIVRDHT